MKVLFEIIFHLFISILQITKIVKIDIDASETYNLPGDLSQKMYRDTQKIKNLGVNIHSIDIMKYVDFAVKKMDNSMEIHVALWLKYSFQHHFFYFSEKSIFFKRFS